MNVWYWLVHITAADYGAPYGRWVWYDFWSGFGADLSMVGAAFGLYLKHVCHTSGCYRLGRHLVDGTPWCNRHHQQVRQEGITNA